MSGRDLCSICRQRIGLSEEAMQNDATLEIAHATCVREMKERISTELREVIVPGQGITVKQWVAHHVAPQQLPFLYEQQKEISRKALELKARYMAERDEARARVAKLCDALDWVRQTVHRAHHSGPLETCETNTCGAAREAMKP
jgi:hypothetical protein